MSEPSLPQKVLAVHRCLAEVKVAHAFGGALALANYAEPRATVDIDVNLFVEPSWHSFVQSRLAELGVGDHVDEETVARDGQARLWWGSTPIDLFYAYDDLHAAMRRRVRRMRFGSESIPVLAPEHLAVCKAIFNRGKDWIDVEQILVGAPGFDSGEALGELERLLGGDDPRTERFARLAVAYAN